MKISIIIPTYNRATSLERTLNSISKLAHIGSLEVIVVDNGSTDNTREVCTKLNSKQEFIFRYIFDNEPGLLTGRHAGALAATGDILCFLDDDVELTSNWLSGVKDAFKDNEVQLATGPSLPNYENPPPDWINYLWYNASNGKVLTWLSLMDLGDNKIDIDPNYVWGLNFCIRKTALLGLGGFHPDNIPQNLQMYQGDGETGLTLKARDQKYVAIYHPDIKVYHFINSERLTIDYFEKRAYYQGVCDSFTSLRKARKTVTSPSMILSVFRTLNTIIRWAPRKVYHLILYPNEFRAIESRLKAKEKEGFEFHQQAYKCNSRVRNWVERNDYWDYKLPV